MMQSYFDDTSSPVMLPQPTMDITENYDPYPYDSYDSAATTTHNLNTKYVLSFLQIVLIYVLVR